MQGLFRFLPYNGLRYGLKNGLFNHLQAGLILITGLIILLSGTITPQQTAAQTLEGEQLFAPFVSRIQAEQNGRRITLTWKDSADVPDGRYLIYRNSEEITDSNFSSAQFLEAVESGTEEYTDIPEEPGEYYYAVIIEGPEQSLYDILIPYRNKTTRPRIVEGEPSPRETAASITGIKAAREEDRVIITYQASRPGRTVALYRGTKPFTSAEALTKDRKVAAADSSETTLEDYPVPGIPYYYALADQELLAAGEHQVDPGDNAAIQSVKIPLGDHVRRLLPERTAARSLPLPALLMQRRITDGSPLSAPPAGMPEPKPLSEAARRAAQALASQFPAKEPQPMEPETLPGDKDPGEDDIHPALTNILEGSFAAEQWKEAQKQLLHYLSRTRTDEEVARGRFYLGQALYFQGRERNAFLEMVHAEEVFPRRSRRWQDRILAALADRD